MVRSLGFASLRVAGLNLPRRAYLDVGRFLVRYDDWWFNLRPSNTEPLLRSDAEAKTEPRMAGDVALGALQKLRPEAGRAASRRGSTP